MQTITRNPDAESMWTDRAREEREYADAVERANPSFNGWQGLHDEAAAKLIEAARLLRMEADVFDIHAALEGLGYIEQHDYWVRKGEPLFDGEYRLEERTYGRDPERRYIDLRVKAHDPQAVEALKLYLIEAGVLDGWDGPDHAWTDATTKVGSVILEVPGA